MQRPLCRKYSGRHSGTSRGGVATGRILSIVLVLSASITAGCGDRTEEAVRLTDRTGAAVSDSLLIEVLAGLHMADAERYLTMREAGRLPETSAPGDTESLERRQTEAAAVDSVLRARGTVVDSVLRVHGMTPAAYDAAVDWYVNHPDQFVNLYNRVLDRLNQAP